MNPGTQKSPFGLATCAGCSTLDCSSNGCIIERIEERDLRSKEDDETLKPSAVMLNVFQDSKSKRILTHLFEQGPPIC